MAFSGQADFGAGIYRGREAPQNAAYDLVNFLIDDEGQPFRRGGSSYRSTGNAGATLNGLAEAFLIPGQRTVGWFVVSLSVLDGSLAPVTVASPAGGGSIVTPSRPVHYRDFLIFRSDATTAPTFYIYAGATKASPGAQTVTATDGSTTVTGAATTWLTQLEPGMIFDGGVEPTIVKQVVSDTQLTLSQPYDGTTGAFSSTLRPFTYDTITGATGAATALATAGGRLLVAVANRLYFSPINVLTFDNVQEDYHELPTDAYIIGAEGLGNSALLFTTTGVWRVGNLEFDVLDDVGNVQHTVERLSFQILWGDAGIAQHENAIIFPAIDNVYVLTESGESTPIGDGIRPLYLSYLKAGYQPGQATVHRGHYFLPILNGSTLVDLLVCRLDRGAAWTRWSGHGAGIAYARQLGASTRSPKLFSIKGQRVTDLTDAWSPSSAIASEADGSTHSIDFQSRDLPTPGRAKGSTTRKVRVRYEATALVTPAFTVSYARGPEGAAWTGLTNIKGGSTSDGLDESVYSVGKQAPAIRFRLESSSPLSTFTLREIEAEYTPSG